MCRSVYLTLTPLSMCRRGLGISTSVQQFLLPSFLYIHVMCARTCTCTYVPIHNAAVVFHEIQCLLILHYDVGRQGVEIYPCIKFCLSQCFLCIYMHIYTYSYWPRLFFEKYGVYIILTMTMFVTLSLYQVSCLSVLRLARYTT